MKAGMAVGGTQLTPLIFCQVFPLPFLSRNQRAWSDCYTLRLVWNFCLACYLAHKFDLLVIKLFLNFFKSSIKFTMANDGEKSSILLNFLNASVSSDKSSVNYSYAQLLFSKDNFIFWNCWYLYWVSVSCVIFRFRSRFDFTHWKLHQVFLCAFNICNDWDYN